MNFKLLEYKYKDFKFNKINENDFKNLSIQIHKSRNLSN